MAGLLALGLHQLLDDAALHVVGALERQLLDADACSLVDVGLVLTRASCPAMLDFGLGLVTTSNCASLEFQFGEGLLLERLGLCACRTSLLVFQGGLLGFDQRWLWSALILRPSSWAISMRLVVLPHELLAGVDEVAVLDVDTLAMIA